MTSSTGEVGVADVVVGGAVSSLVLRSLAAERRVLGRLLNNDGCKGQKTVINLYGMMSYLFLDRFDVLSGGEGEGTRPRLRVPRSRRPNGKLNTEKRKTGEGEVNLTSIGSFRLEGEVT